MKSSIYISTEQIQVIGHAGGSVKRLVTYPLPEGTMINGMITDHAFLTECLASMRKENPDLFKNPALIVDGSSILSRRIITPAKLDKKHIRQVVRDDFADTTENPNDLVCGYHKLGGAEKGAIFACAANKAQVDSYINTFKEAEIKLEAIHVGAQAILNFVDSQPELRKANFVLNLIDGVTMLSMIFENGVNVFMSRSRLYGEEKEPLFQNVIENLSGLIQFNRSQKFNDITHSYYLGINEGDMRLLDALSPYTDIKLEALNIFKSAKANLPPEAHFAYLNALLGNDSIDLISGRRELDKHVKSQRPKKLWIPLMAVYIVLLALPGGYFRYLVYQVDQEIAVVNDSINNPGIQERLTALRELSSDTTDINGIVNQMVEKEAWESSMAKISGDLLEMILISHGEDVTVTQFDFNEKTGVLRVGAVCVEADTIEKYINALYRSGMVTNVKYPGFDYNSDGMCSFTIDITLSNGEAE